MSSNVIRDLGWKSELKSVPANLPQLVQIDSRKILAGQWFVPFIGAHFDAHTFIPEVLAKGAGGFFYERSKRETIDSNLRTRGIEVEDTTKTLQDLGRWWRLQHNDCHLVGITGSSGKTSVKELSFAMLEALSPTLKTEGSLNNELGVPLTLCRLDSRHRFGIIEMGARHKGDIEFLGHIVQQDVGVLVNVGSAHIGEFGSAEKILEAKMEIMRAARCVYFRDDDRIAKAIAKLSGRTLTSFGYHKEADVRIVSEELDNNGSLSLHLSCQGSEKKVTLPYYHQSYSLNVACSLAIGISLGLSLAECLPGLQKFRGVKGRFQVHDLAGFTLIDDAYNANPQSMRAGIETVARAYPTRSKVLILGDMKELGDISEQEHRSIGTFCAKELKNLRLVTVGAMGEWMAAGALDAGFPSKQLSSYADVECLLPHLPEICQDAQLLYVKASNSLKLSKIIDTLLSK